MGHSRTLVEFDKARSRIGSANATDAAQQARGERCTARAADTKEEPDQKLERKEQEQRDQKSLEVEQATQVRTEESKAPDLERLTRKKRGQSSTAREHLEQQRKIAQARRDRLKEEERTKTKLADDRMKETTEAQMSEELTQKILSEAARDREKALTEAGPSVVERSEGNPEDESPVQSFVPNILSFIFGGLLIVIAIPFGLTSAVRPESSVGSTFSTEQPRASS